MRKKVRPFSTRLLVGGILVVAFSPFLAEPLYIQQFWVNRWINDWMDKPFIDFLLLFMLCAAELSGILLFIWGLVEKKREDAKK